MPPACGHGHGTARCSPVALGREFDHARVAVAVASNKEAVQLATRLYTEGQTDFLNVLSAQRALYSVQDALVQSERTVAAELVAVYKALGGGWESNDGKGMSR